MTGYTEFPSGSEPLNLQIFPAAYYQDVDFDGLPDLIVAPNVDERISFTINFSQSAWLIGTIRFYTRSKNPGCVVYPCQSTLPDYTARDDFRSLRCSFFGKR